MNKSVGAAMKFERAGNKVKPNIGILDQFSTGRLLVHLYKRWETEILYSALCLMGALYLWDKLGG